MKTLMISSAIAAAIAASAFGVNAQTVAAPAAPKAGSPLIGKVLKTNGTKKAVATNAGEVEGTENEGGGESGSESGGDSD